MIRRALLVPLVALLALPAAAAAQGADTIRVTVNGFQDANGAATDSLSIVGTSGQDIVQITPTPPGDGPFVFDRLNTMTIASLGTATVTPSGACRRPPEFFSDLRRVECAFFAQSVRVGRIALGGGADRARITQGGWRWEIDYGPGDDVIDASVLFPEETGALDHTVDGGTGADEFVGSFRERVALRGGDGDDVFRQVGGRLQSIDGGAGDDAMDVRDYATVVGGPGDDVIRLRPVPAASTAATMQVLGGPGDDVITWLDPRSDDRTLIATGGAGDDTIVGGSGDDTLRGDDPTQPSLAGADFITGGGGVDEIVGGPGPDLIDAVDGRPDRVLCGTSDAPGVTTVVNGRRLTLRLPHIDIADVDLRDADQGDCEQVRRQAIDVPPAATVRGTPRVAPGGRLSVALSCPRSAPAGCRGRVSSRLAPVRGRLARAGGTPYRIARGRVAVVSVPMPAALRSALTRRGAAVARVTTIERDGRGDLRRAQRTVVVRAR